MSALVPRDEMIRHVQESVGREETARLASEAAVQRQLEEIWATIQGRGGEENLDEF